MIRQPTIFLSHGAPTMALEPGQAGQVLATLGHQLAAQPATPPVAILIISPHWDTASARVGSAAHPETIHDFFGFPQALYELQYPAPGAPTLATRVRELLESVDIACEIDPARGLDHGAWSPMRFMFPDANIPVTQLSLQSRMSPAHQFNIGRALAPLREENVLIIGSGSMTHNLSEFRGNRLDSPALPYVTEFAEWFAQKIEERDLESLLDYRRRAPHAVRAHPADDHLLPIFIALGAADVVWQSQRLVQEVMYGMLAMDTYRFQ
jgi:4,5-DOPA dioxygenase extradiol